MRLDRILALALALMLCLSLTAPAFAETKYPPRPQGTVADLAGVLGEKTIADMETLNTRMNTAAGGSLFVLTRHFLGGVNANTYAKKVFDVWGLGTGDALLHALAAGAAERGQRSLNLGLGIDEGIAFFKKKWGARVLMPHKETSWSLA